MSANFDVIIVGAGPSGAAAALALVATPGLRVCIIDQARLPRHKACGGVFSERLLSKLAVDGQAMIEHSVSTHRYTNRGLDLALQHGAVSAVERRAFDFSLIEAAVARGRGDVVVMDEFRVDRVSQEAGKVVVVGKGGDRLVAGVVIGCDGAFSRVARYTGLNVAPNIRPAIDIDIEVANETFDSFSDHLTLDLFEVPDGYGWVFPKRNILSCGILSWSGSSNLNTALAAYLDRRFSGEYRIERRMGTVFRSTRPKSHLLRIACCLRETLPVWLIRSMDMASSQRSTAAGWRAVRLV